MPKAQRNNLTILFISIVVIALLFMYIFGYQEGSLAKFFGFFKYDSGENNNLEGFQQDKKCNVESNNYRYVMKPITSESEGVVYYETCDFKDFQSSYEGILGGSITKITDTNGNEVTLNKGNIKIEVYENKENGNLLKSIDFNDIENEQGGIISLFYISTNVMRARENEIKNKINAILDENEIVYNSLNVFFNKPTSSNFADVSNLEIIIKYENWENDGTYTAQITFSPNITIEDAKNIFNKVSAYLFRVDNEIVNISTTSVTDTDGSFGIDYTAASVPSAVSNLVVSNTLTQITNVINSVSTTTTTTTTGSENIVTGTETATSGSTTTTTGSGSENVVTGSETATSGSTTTTGSENVVTGTETATSGSTTTTGSENVVTGTETATSGSTTTTGSGSVISTTSTGTIPTTNNVPMETEEAERQQEILDRLAQLYNNDSELSQEMIETVKTLPPQKRESICRDYCNYITATNAGFCEAVECANNDEYSIQSQIVDGELPDTGYAAANGIYSLLDADKGTMEDYLQSGSYKYMFEDGYDQRIPHFVNRRPNRASTTNIIQKDTEGVSNIFAPNIFVLPKKNGNGYASYMMNDPNDPSYMNFINSLVEQY
jgi:hypothetical protein